jgi:polysaccharide pyruvyl transferase WcaK-like protein
MSLSTRRRWPSCLLLGYGGAGNIGSDVRLITALEDVRASFGGKVFVTVATQDRERTLKLIPEVDGVRVVQIPFLFAGKVPLLAATHDVTLLAEGSTFKQSWSRWLLYCFLSAAWSARRAGKHCVAYAVDAGELSPFNTLLTRRVCNGLSLLITRTQVARERLLDMGVRRPILANTDTAFQYLLDRPPQRGPRRTVGVAPIEFYHWPVRLSPFGRKRDRYHWPFHFTWTAERRALSARMVEHYRDLLAHCIDQYDLDVTLIAMEELDMPTCARILAASTPKHRPRIRLVSSQNLPPDQMVPLLRGLDYLVTSRYHACVLSMAGAVPQMAVSHDERLASIYQELGLDAHFLLDYRAAGLAPRLLDTFDRLVRSGPEVAEVLRRKHDDYFLPRCAQNRADLRAWVEQHFTPGQGALRLGSPRQPSGVH